MAKRILSITDDPTDLEICREATLDMARSAGFSSQEVGDIVCAVFETCANAVVHGRGNGATDIRLSLETSSVGLEAVVRDNGAGFDCPEDTPMPSVWANRGRGIPLMKTCMDEVRIERHSGCCVTLIKRRRKVG